MKVLVDSSVWIDYLADRSTPEVEHLDTLLRTESVVLGDLMVCEVLQGIRNDREFRETWSTLLALEVLTIGGPSLAVKAASNYRALRRKGVTVRGTVDCLIATYCIESGLPLLHSDRDFEPFERHLGLAVVSVPAR